MLHQRMHCSAGTARAQDCASTFCRWLWRGTFRQQDRAARAPAGARACLLSAIGLVGGVTAVEGPPSPCTDRPQACARQAFLLLAWRGGAAAWSWPRALLARPSRPACPPRVRRRPRPRPTRCHGGGSALFASAAKRPLSRDAFVAALRFSICGIFKPPIHFRHCFVRLRRSRRALALSSCRLWGSLA
ncbi:MAG: hypothetical protein J3K34DRAFT_430210 [Monoraphidium minutum]|nr:MAG: hypothetical protein J3K34DRAFT_430210 [Monoraphidium minutum]